MTEGNRDTGEPVSIAYPTTSPSIRFSVRRLERVLDGRVRVRDLEDVLEATIDGVDGVDVVIVSNESSVDGLERAHSAFEIPESLGAEGFTRSTVNLDGATVTVVVAPDDAGAMYGTLDLAEQLEQRGTLDAVEETTTSPEVGFRAIKFNLPWSVYHGGEQAEPHLDTCRDLSFWEAFLDMMAENRFNALTLWNIHPFPFMVQTEAFPEACPFSETELEEWRRFWHELFQMAADRCIETYIVNWNILVSPEFAAANDVSEWNDTSELVREYTREHVREVLEEYENLTGLGISLCDWMGDMTPGEKQDWFEETFLEAIAAVDRPVTVLDRSVLTESIDEMRRGIDSAATTDNVSKIYVPTKFNWSHGHSTTSLELTHDYTSGAVDDSLWNPEPENYEIAWMIRNEDFFVLRWGDPEFIREHIAENYTPNTYVGGYFVGSEVNIPAVDISHRPHPHRTWQYAFEKQWLFYTLWGRLLYDPSTPDKVFEAAFDRRYGRNLGTQLLEGYRNASQMSLELATFHAGTWDYTQYSEGFLAPVEEAFGLDDEVSPFISIDELIDHEPLDPSYVSIPAFVGRDEWSEERTTPLDIATKMDRTGKRALEIADSIRQDFGSYTGALIEDGDSRGRRAESEHNEYPGALECEIEDLLAWGHLSAYFAAKLRGGVALERYRTTSNPETKVQAVSHLETAAESWDAVVEVTRRHYRKVPYATDWIDGEMFSWATYRDQVERDIEIAETAEPSTST